MEDQSYDNLDGMVNPAGLEIERCLRKAKHDLLNYLDLAAKTQRAEHLQRIKQMSV
jgi:hypothetical protein